MSGGTRANPSRVRWGRLLGRGLTLLLAIPLAYLAAGSVGGVIPANRGFTAATRDGVTIFVETNGVHTGIVVPVAAAGIDWRDLVRAEHLADPGRAGTHIAFGWGERAFYLATPRWADLDLRTTLRASLGSDTVLLHVYHLPPPIAGPDSRPVTISRAQYRRLAASIRARFALDRAGRSRPIRGYGPADIFYVSRGRYDAVRTCNAWTGDMLRAAGIRVGAWTPFSWTVMRWFPPPDA